MTCSYLCGLRRLEREFDCLTEGGPLQVLDCVAHTSVPLTVRSVSLTASLKEVHSRFLTVLNIFLSL